MPKLLPLLLLPFLLVAGEPVLVLLDGDTVELDSALARLCPDSSDFVFEPPESWGENLALSASVTVDSAAYQPGIEALTDGDPWTAWSSKPGIEKPVIELSFEQPVEFNRLVIFNRHTHAWGTAGGNNAARRIRLQVDPSAEDSEAYVREIELTGPVPLCLRQASGVGQVCFFIQDTSHDVFELPDLESRHLTLEVTGTSVQDIGRETWPEQVNCALSEVMLFYVPPTDS
ncbi:MAG: hypothetical protein JSU73_13915 [candidate division WOR-3 bacterium]|nr:MAG: hypothetical protein JSU73_13915 [candidate division WOR-3 bacterium]